MSGSWARRWATVFCSALVAALFAAVGASAQESQPNTACQGLRTGDQVDVVLLLDQSSSMGDDATQQVREGIDIVGSRLQDLINQGVDVRWAVVGFGSEALKDGQVLLPLSPISSVADGFQELQKTYTTNDPNTDYRSGLLGAREQLRGSTAECRLLLWFTDGQFDIGPDGKDSGDAPAVIDGVCASGLADWFQDSNVRSFVILSNDWDIGKWERQFTSEGVLEASLSVMQAITGSENLADGDKGKQERDIANLLEDREYEVDAACFPYTQGRAEVGEVLLNAGDLDDIFDVLMAEILGDTKGTTCPSAPEQGLSESGRFVVRSNDLPDGLFLDQVSIYNLNGEESALSVFAQPADGSQRQPLSLTDKAIDSGQLKSFAAGWSIEIEGPSDMEICIFYPDLERVGSAEVDVKREDQPRPLEASQDSALFSVDLSEVPIIDKALREGRSLDGLLVGFGVYNEDWSASWPPGGTSAELTFQPTSPGTVQSVDLWIDLETGAGDSPDRISLDGQLRPTLEVTAPAGAPKIDCSEGTTGTASREMQELGLNGGEVPKEGFVSSIECVVTPPEDDVARVDFSLPETGNDSFENLGFVFATSSGNFDPGHTELLEPGDAPLTFRLEIPEALDNRTWNTSGTFVVTVTWDRPAAGNPYTDDATVEVLVDLLARSDTGFALLITLLIAALAVLVSFGLFRFMNSLVKIPGPEGFFARAADIKIVNATAGAPRFEWFDESQLEEASVVKAKSPGRDLIADGVTLTRRIPPFFKPWNNTTARAAGFNTIRSSPAAGKSEAPGSFSELVLVATNDSPNEAGELDARVVVLHPKPHRPEASRLRREIDQMVAPLVAQLADKSGPALAGTPSLGGSSSQTTDNTAPETPTGPSSSNGGGIAPPPQKPPSNSGGIAPPPKRPQG